MIGWIRLTPASLGLPSESVEQALTIELFGNDGD